MFVHSLMLYNFYFPTETMAPRYEICVGLNKGHKTTKIKQLKYKGEHKTKGVRPQRLKNVSISNETDNLEMSLNDETTTNPFTDSAQLDRFSYYGLIFF